MPPEIREAFLIHLINAAPNEGVGLLATTAWSPDDDGVMTATATAWYPGTNIDHSPNRYTMDPVEVLRAMQEMREQGQELGAIVHSHLRGPATPSATDISEAFYPDALMVIVSFVSWPASIRAWNVRREDNLQIVRHVDIEPR